MRRFDIRYFNTRQNNELPKINNEKT